LTLEVLLDAQPPYQAASPLVVEETARIETRMMPSIKYWKPIDSLVRVTKVTISVSIRPPANVPITLDFPPDTIVPPISVAAIAVSR